MALGSVVGCAVALILVIAGNSDAAVVKGTLSWQIEVTAFFSYKSTADRDNMLQQILDLWKTTFDNTYQLSDEKITVVRELPGPEAFENYKQLTFRISGKGPVGTNIKSLIGTFTTAITAAHISGVELNLTSGSSTDGTTSFNVDVYANFVYSTSADRDRLLQQILDLFKAQFANYGFTNLKIAVKSEEPSEVEGAKLLTFRISGQSSSDVNIKELNTKFMVAIKTSGITGITLPESSSDDNTHNKFSLGYTVTLRFVTPAQRDLLLQQILQLWIQTYGPKYGVINPQITVSGAAKPSPGVTGSFVVAYTITGGSTTPLPDTEVKVDFNKILSNAKIVGVVVDEDTTTATEESGTPSSKTEEGGETEEVSTAKAETQEATTLGGETAEGTTPATAGEDGTTSKSETAEGTTPESAVENTPKTETEVATTPGGETAEGTTPKVETEEGTTAKPETEVSVTSKPQPDESATSQPDTNTVDEDNGDGSPGDKEVSSAGRDLCSTVSVNQINGRTITRGQFSTNFTVYLTYKTSIVRNDLLQKLLAIWGDILVQATNLKMCFYTEQLSIGKLEGGLLVNKVTYGISGMATVNFNTAAVSKVFEQAVADSSLTNVFFTTDFGDCSTKSVPDTNHFTITVNIIVKYKTQTELDAILQQILKLWIQKYGSQYGATHVTIKVTGKKPNPSGGFSLTILISGSSKTVIDVTKITKQFIVVISSSKITGVQIITGGSITGGGSGTSTEEESETEEDTTTPKSETEEGTTPKAETEEGTTTPKGEKGTTTPKSETEEGTTPKGEAEEGTTPKPETEEGTTPKGKKGSTTPKSETEEGTTPHSKIVEDTTPGDNADEEVTTPGSGISKFKVTVNIVVKYTTQTELDAILQQILKLWIQKYGSLYGATHVTIKVTGKKPSPGGGFSLTIVISGSSKTVIDVTKITKEFITVISSVKITGVQITTGGSITGGGSGTSTDEGEETEEGATTPKSEREKGTSPKGSTEDGTTPKGETEEGTTPKSETKEGTTPKTETEEATTPKGETEEGTTPKSETEEGTTPKTETAERTTPKGETEEGTTPKGETEEVTTPKSETEEGTTPKGETEEATTPHSKTEEGTTPQSESGDVTTPASTETTEGSFKVSFQIIVTYKTQVELDSILQQILKLWIQKYGSKYGATGVTIKVSTKEANPDGGFLITVIISGSSTTVFDVQTISKQFITVLISSKIAGVKVPDNDSDDNEATEGGDSKGKKFVYDFDVIMTYKTETEYNNLLQKILTVWIKYFEKPYGLVSGKTVITGTPTATAKTTEFKVHVTITSVQTIDVTTLVMRQTADKFWAIIDGNGISGVVRASEEEAKDVSTQATAEATPAAGDEESATPTATPATHNTGTDHDMEDLLGKSFSLHFTRYITYTSEAQLQSILQLIYRLFLDKLGSTVEFTRSEQSEIHVFGTPKPSSVKGTFQVEFVITFWAKTTLSVTELETKFNGILTGNAVAGVSTEAPSEAATDSSSEDDDSAHEFTLDMTAYIKYNTDAELQSKLDEILKVWFGKFGKEYQVTEQKIQLVGKPQSTSVKGVFQVHFTITGETAMFAKITAVVGQAKTPRFEELLKSQHIAGVWLHLPSAAELGDSDDESADSGNESGAESADEGAAEGDNADTNTATDEGGKFDVSENQQHGKTVGPGKFDVTLTVYLAYDTAGIRDNFLQRLLVIWRNSLNDYQVTDLKVEFEKDQMSVGKLPKDQGGAKVNKVWYHLSGSTVLPFNTAVVSKTFEQTVVDAHLGGVTFTLGAFGTKH